jgi:ribosomal protein L9
VIGGFIARAVALAGRAVVGAAVNAAATELKRPENQQKLAEHAHAVAEHAQAVGEKLRDPETLKSGARALGRAFGTLRNKL